MKLVVELNDSDLRKAVADQVGRAIASITDDLIREKTNEILTIKFGRVDEKMIEAAIDKAALAVVRTTNNERSTWGSIVSLARTSIQEAAVAAVKEALARKYA